jgi:two-component sensor histidine kinase
MQARIGAIAALYDVMSLSNRIGIVTVDDYLRKIANTMAASLLGDASGITIEVDAEPLEIDPELTVPLGLLVNELATNAIKHAFPDGAGRVLFMARKIGHEIELTVSDNGVGLKNFSPMTQSRGLNYVAIFVRQLGGEISTSGAPGLGTTIQVRFPPMLKSGGSDMPIARAAQSTSEENARV